MIELTEKEMNDLVEKIDGVVQEVISIKKFLAAKKFRFSEEHPSKDIGSILEDFQVIHP